MTDRITSCMKRLACDHETATLVTDRHLPTCSAMVTNICSDFEEHNLRVREGKELCSDCASAPGDYTMACDLLVRLWHARSYRDLAKAGAPVDDAWPCQCNGSGIYYLAGATVNGVFQGQTGPCFPCASKGWQSAADRKRNAYYNAHVRRVNF